MHTVIKKIAIAAALFFSVFGLSAASADIPKRVEIPITIINESGAAVTASSTCVSDWAAFSTGASTKLWKMVSGPCTVTAKKPGGACVFKLSAAGKNDAINISAGNAKCGAITTGRSFTLSVR